MPEKLTQEKFKEKVDKLFGKDEYEILGEYVNNHTKILVRHNKCGSEFLKVPREFLCKHGCPVCAKKIIADKRRKSTEDFKKEVEILTNGEYEVLGEYKGSLEKILIRHNVCGNTYEVVPKYFLRGDRCQKCLHKKKEKYKQEFIDYMNSVEDYSFDVSTYIDRNHKVKFFHKTCGREFMMIPEKFMKSISRCPFCRRKSKNEDYVEDFLKSKDITFIRHYFEEKLVDKRKLEFDFKIYFNNSEYFFLECQGIQHEKPVEFFGGEEKFLYQKKHDEMKEKFAKDNNIDIHFIPYQYSERKLIEKLSQILDHYKLL